VVKIATWRNDLEDMSMYFDIGFLGYTYDLSRKGLRQFSENNKEQVVKFKWNTNDCELFLKDGTKIVAISPNRDRVCGYRFDQLILFDDDRWLIKENKWREIDEIMCTTMHLSCVPEDYQIIFYEDIR
jgi:hypothetical protein